jgi:hypothetical protein
MLAATADGRKLQPLLILKRKTLPKLETFPKEGPGKRMDDGGADVGVAENGMEL